MTRKRRTIRKASPASASSANADDIVLEIGCDITGQPRLDPARIDSAGLVVRRVHEPVMQAGQLAFGERGEDLEQDRGRSGWHEVLAGALQSARQLHKHVAPTKIRRSSDAAWPTI